MKALQVGRWSRACYSTDPYSALWSSLKVKPEAVRVSELLTSDMDQAAQNQLTNIWRRNLRDSASLDRITGSISPSHSHNSQRIWHAALYACAQQAPSYLADACRELKAKIGQVPAKCVVDAISVSLKAPTSTLLAEFLNEIPAYVLRDCLDENLEFWSQISTPTLLAPIVIHFASRGVLPRSDTSINVLKRLTSRDQLKYIEATTDFLEKSRDATPLTTKLCVLFICILSPSSQDSLAKFLHAAQAARKAPNKESPVGLRVLTELAKRELNVEVNNKFLKTTAMALNADTVAGAYQSLSTYGPLLGTSARSFVSLYANWLRCCARDSPHDLNRFFASAQMACAEHLGERAKRGRERILLSGIICGLIESHNWAMISNFIPQIMKTNTPFLWNTAVIASKDWDLVEKMRVKKLSLSTNAMKALCSRGDLQDFNKLLGYCGVLPQSVVVSFLHRVNSKNIYGYTGLLKFYREVFDALKHGIKAKHGQVYPVLNHQVVQEVVWGALRTMPKKPWVITQYLKELTDSKLTTNESVVLGIAEALQAAQELEGTAAHIRSHLAMSIPALARKFNAEWKDLDSS